MGKRAPKSKPENRSRQAERKPDGTFAKGVSGNPGGRPADADEIIGLARIDSREAYDKAVAIMRNDEHRQQLTAALAILKLAGVFRNADDAPGAKPPDRPYATQTTTALLHAATASTTLPQ